MKMVAASKLKRSREQAEAAAPYASRMESIVRTLASGAQTDPNKISLLTGTGKDKTHLVVVATSDRGLCGGFNSSIIKASKKHIDNLLKEGKTVKIFCVGKKGYDILKGQYGNKIISKVDGLGRKGIKFAESSEIAEKILELFEKGEFDVCSIIFNKFKSAITQILTNQQLIPLSIDDASNNNEANSIPYDYEPSEEEILEQLLPKNIAIQIYYSLLENNASEQGARMSAMDSATRNSGEMIKKLNLVYNRTRQAYITKELIEIISGAEALK